MLNRRAESEMPSRSAQSSVEKLSWHFPASPCLCVDNLSSSESIRGFLLHGLRLEQLFFAEVTPGLHPFRQAQFRQIICVYTRTDRARAFLLCFVLNGVCHMHSRQRAKLFAQEAHGIMMQGHRFDDRHRQPPDAKQT